MPDVEIVPFPPARRGRLIREVAADIASIGMPAREHYWREACDDIALPLLHAGVAPDEVRRAIIGLLGKGGALALLAGGLKAVRLAGTPVAGFFETLAMRNALAARSLARTPRLLERIGDATRVLVRRVPGVGLLAKGFGLMGGAVAGLTAPVWGAIAAGVIAIAAGGLWLYRNWDRASSVVSGFARRIGEELAPALDWISEKWDAIKSALGLDGVFDAIGAGLTKAREAISGFVDWVKSFFTREVLGEEEKAAWGEAGYGMADRLIEGIKAAFAGGAVLFDLGVEAVQSLWDGMVARFDQLLDWVRGIPGRIASAIGDISLRGAVSSMIPEGIRNRFGGGEESATSGHRAKGGPVWSGGSFLVGEDEPEVFTPKTGGEITPLSAIERSTNKLLSSASRGSSSPAAGGNSVALNGGIHIHVDGARDPENLIRTIRSRIEDEIDAALRGINADSGVRA